MPYGTKNPLLNYSALVGSKIMQRSTRVNHVSEKPLIKVYCNTGSKVMWVSWYQQEVKLLRNTPKQPNVANVRYKINKIDIN